MELGSQRVPHAGNQMAAGRAAQAATNCVRGDQPPMRAKALPSSPGFPATGDDHPAAPPRPLSPRIESTAAPLFAPTPDRTVLREPRREAMPSYPSWRPDAGGSMPNGAAAPAPVQHSASSAHPPAGRKRVILINRRSPAADKLVDTQSEAADFGGKRSPSPRGLPRDADVLTPAPLAAGRQRLPPSFPITSEAVVTPGQIDLVRRSSTPELRSSSETPAPEVSRSKPSSPEADSPPALTAETAKTGGARIRRSSSPTARSSFMIQRPGSPYSRMRSHNNEQRSLSPTPPNRAKSKVRSGLRPAIKKTRSLDSDMDANPRKSVHFAGKFVQTRTFRQWTSSAAIAELPTDLDDPSVKDQQSANGEKIVEGRDGPGSRAPKAARCCEIVPVNIPPCSTLFHGRAVLLESVSLGLDGRSVSGLAQVANYAYTKEVAVRYTFDQWAHHVDIPAQFRETVVPRSHNFPGLDRFAFTIPVPERAPGKGQVRMARGSAGAAEEAGNFGHDPDPPADLVREMAFALRYQVAGEDYWDNNEKRNYLVRVHTRACSSGEHDAPRDSQNSEPSTSRGAAPAARPGLPRTSGSGDAEAR